MSWEKCIFYRYFYWKVRVDMICIFIYGFKLLRVTHLIQFSSNFWSMLDWVWIEHICISNAVKRILQQWAITDETYLYFGEIFDFGKRLAYTVGNTVFSMKTFHELQVRGGPSVWSTLFLFTFGDEIVTRTFKRKVIHLYIKLYNIVLVILEFLSGLDFWMFHFKTFRFQLRFWGQGLALQTSRWYFHELQV